MHRSISTQVSQQLALTLERQTLHTQQQALVQQHMSYYRSAQSEGECLTLAPGVNICSLIPWAQKGLLAGVVERTTQCSRVHSKEEYYSSA